jgi:hypothetical protein
MSRLLLSHFPDFQDVGCRLNTDSHYQGKREIKMTKFYIHYVRYALSTLAMVAFGTHLN